MDADQRGPRVSFGMKVFFAVVILGFGAAGYGGLKTYIDKSSEKSSLEERGVETDASVSSVTEISGRRIETYHKLQVAYGAGSAEIQDCSGHRYESGADTVKVVYLPDDPEVVRLAACLPSFDTNILPGIIGLVFAGLALFILWRVRGVWTS